MRKFFLLTRPCGPLENAPRAKFGPRAKIFVPLITKVSMDRLYGSENRYCDSLM